MSNQLASFLDGWLSALSVGARPLPDLKPARLTHFASDAVAQDWQTVGYDMQQASQSIQHQLGTQQINRQLERLK